MGLMGEGREERGATLWLAVLADGHLVRGPDWFLGGRHHRPAFIYLEANPSAKFFYIYLKFLSNFYLELETSIILYMQDPRINP